MFRLAPSILSANFAKLGQEITDVIASGADIVHFDVMTTTMYPITTVLWRGNPSCHRRHHRRA